MNFTAVALTACLWTNPGADPYTGTVEWALSNLSIPAQHRAVIASKIHARLPDDRLYIGKDYVMSVKWDFGDVMWMHFGRDKLCYGVDRSKWADDHEEKGQVYCSGPHCVGIPDACGNITQLFQRRDVPQPRYDMIDVPPLEPPLEPPTLRLVPPQPTLPTGGTWIHPTIPPPINKVPEPGTLALLLVAGVAALSGRRR